MMSKKQTIFRVAKNKDNPYVVVNKKFLESPELSYRAKGILSYILSKPDHWQLNVNDLVKHGKEGRDAVYTALKELIRLGFIHSACHRENGKISHYEYMVYEQPLPTPVEGTTHSAAIEEEIVQEQEVHGSRSSISIPHTGNLDTAYPDTRQFPSRSLSPDIPEPAPEPTVSGGNPLPGNPETENQAQGCNDLNNKLINNHKTSSSGARCVSFELWREVFGEELQDWEYESLCKGGSRSTLVRNICLIQEHHSLSRIQSPFAFVYTCVMNGGYQVAKETRKQRPYNETERKSAPLPKAVARQLDESYVKRPKYSEEELAVKKARIEQKLLEMRESQQAFRAAR